MNALQFGSTFEMLLLALALADRFNEVRRDKERAQEEALRVQKAPGCKSATVERELAQSRDAAEAEPGQERLPRQHEPRDPHTDERHHRPSRASCAGRNNPEADGTTRQINTAAEHLLGTINDILDISKIEAESCSLKKRPVNINTLLNNVSSILSEPAKAKGIPLLMQS